VTALTTISPPSSAQRLGHSPNASATQSGDRIGSITGTSTTSSARAWRIAAA
jgi:hypothetical protein